MIDSKTMTGPGPQRRGDIKRSPEADLLHLSYRDSEVAARATVRARGLPPVHVPPVSATGRDARVGAGLGALGALPAVHPEQRVAGAARAPGPGLSARHDLRRVLDLVLPRPGQAGRGDVPG